MVDNNYSPLIQLFYVNNNLPLELFTVDNSYYILRY